jgi:2-polyprenyl-6-methoxyphenol hydroxylase-like FAD-dependent oxidoreductase
MSADVLVVGAGPAGLVAGITLAHYGARVVVLEKRERTSTLARALVVSTRSMEIFRSWGLEADILAGAADVEPRAWVSHTMASDDGRELPLGYPSAAEAAAISPTRPAWAPQDYLEPLLQRRLDGQPTAATRFGAELVGLDQTAGGVRAVVEDRSTGAREVLEAGYVIGADGAHSTVRSLLGITMDGPDDMDEYHRVEFRAALRDVVGERRYGLYVVTHADAASVIAPRGNRDRWGLSKEWHPGQPRLVDQPDDELRHLIATAVGRPVPDARLERRSSFAFAAQIADTYRRGRGFVIGDAAHRMTPRGGTGMNTAIQDAYDIGWKLGWVLRGWAGPELLDTYESERRPIGLHNVGRAASPDGARRETDDALGWDLNGRVAHYWIDGDGGRRSTLDLLGEGLTRFAGAVWREPAAEVRTAAPVSTVRLDDDAADALGLAPDGMLLLRPDGQPL